MIKKLKCIVLQLQSIIRIVNLNVQRPFPQFHDLFSLSGFRYSIYIIYISFTSFHIGNSEKYSLCHVYNVLSSFQIRNPKLHNLIIGGKKFPVYLKIIFKPKICKCFFFFCLRYCSHIASSKQKFFKKEMF